MKKLYATAYVAILLLCTYIAEAQSTPPLNEQVADKPLLFASLPQKLECNLEEIDRLFMAETSQKMILRLNNQLQLDGIVAERVQQSPEVVSINFKLGKYPGTLFNISRIIQNGTIRYSGRIISRDNGDVLSLVKDNEKYYFTKLSQKFLMVE
ncbi:MAG TPA: hypothetical protein VGD17_10545 [Chitinophagaceae bacterium]